MGHSPAALEQVLPVETALDDIPALALSETEANRLRCGQAVSMVARANRERISALSNGSIVFTTTGGKPVALARYAAGDIHPDRKRVVSGQRVSVRVALDGCRTIKKNKKKHNDISTTT